MNSEDNSIEVDEKTIFVAFHSLVNSFFESSIFHFVMESSNSFLDSNFFLRTIYSLQFTKIENFDFYRFLCENFSNVS